MVKIIYYGMYKNSKLSDLYDVVFKEVGIGF